MSAILFQRAAVMSRETPHMQIITVNRVLSSVACLATLAAGCAGPLNHQIGLTGTDLPALSAQPARDAPSAEPSLDGLDRSQWPTLMVTVPVRQVEPMADPDGDRARAPS